MRLCDRFRAGPAASCGPKLSEEGPKARHGNEVRVSSRRLTNTMADQNGMSRRAFLRTAGAAAIGAVGAASIARGAWAQVGDRPLRAGLLGCGGRGTGAAHDFLNSSENVEVVALADLFEDRLNGCRNSLRDRGQQIPDDHCFTGFDCYREILATDIDVILIATPVYFRPIEFAAAVAAGKHVFMEKPLAVDPPGCREVMRAAEEADQKGLSVVVGTQRRHQAPYLACLERIRDGAIGDIVAARASWCGGPLGGWDRTDQPTDIESQIRAWFHFTWLSGDHIVEQHIHNIDVCNWFKGTHPIRAYGMGYRARKTFGNGYDFFSVDFVYPDGTHMESKCRQIAGCHDDVSEWIVGTNGTAACWGEIWDGRGNRIWNWQGDYPNPYVQEHTDLVSSIRNGTPINDAHEVAASVMTGIMGRMSAYTGRYVSWDDVMNSDLRLGPAKCELGMHVPIDPVPVPGT